MTTPTEAADPSLTARSDALLEELARGNVPPRFATPEQIKEVSARIFKENAELFRKLAAC